MHGFDLGLDLGLGVALSLAAPQQPAVTGPQFAWPPVREQPLRYRAVLEKRRELSTELEGQMRAARKAAGLAAARQPKQVVQLEIAVLLAPAARIVGARYETRLLGKPRLFWRLTAAADGEQAPALGNDRLDVWGLPDHKRAAPAAVPRSALERAFARDFERDGLGAARPAEPGEQFGDHLIPVLWDRPLPCWIGHMASVVELAGEAAIEGKTLIRDGSGKFPLGHRETRVELEFTRVSGDAFTFTYAMKVRQIVARTRDLEHPLPRPWEWHFGIEGEATYAADDQAFDRIRERVTGWPVSLDDDRLARLRDEAFAGTIEIERVRDDEKRGRQRRRRTR